MTPPIQLPSLLTHQKKLGRKFLAFLRPRHIAYGGLLVALLVGAWIIANIFFGNPSIRVTVSSPSAQVFLNDQPLRPGQRLEPGRSYQILVGGPGFITQRLTIKPKRFQPIRRSITLAPAPKPTPVAQGISSVSVSRENGTVIMIDAAQKTFYRLNLLPNNRYDVAPISRDVIPELRAPPILSPDFLLAIFLQADGTAGLFDFKLYDLTSQEYHDWGLDISGVAWRSDGQRLVYVYSPPTGERSLIKVDPDQNNLERIFDLRPEGIVKPLLGWSQDQNVITLVSKGNLYMLDAVTKVLTRLVTDGVTSATLSPNNRQIAYTQYGELKLLGYELVDRFSTNSQVQKNIGRIIIGDPIGTKLTADAADTVYSNDGNRLYAIANNHVWEIFASSGASRQITVNESAKVADLDVSQDGNHLYVIIGSTLYDWYIQ